VAPFKQGRRRAARVEIPESHPRYESLMTRHLVEDGVKAGMTAAAGLIAHGRGEAFDYLLGESTGVAGRAATAAAAAHLALAQRPVLSINGNAAVLAPQALAALQRALGCRVEINLFYRTPERVDKLVTHMEAAGCTDVLGRDAPAGAIPGLSHERSRSSPGGVVDADVVLVPLEDGDRCAALKDMGKTVLVVDLNPLSRTARAADVSITDNLVRAAPALADLVPRYQRNRDEALALLEAYDHEANLLQARREMAERLLDADF